MLSSLYLINALSFLQACVGVQRPHSAPLSRVLIASHVDIMARLMEKKCGRSLWDFAA